MIGNYEVWLSHWDGTRLAYLDGWLNLEYTRALHGVGALSLQVPSSFDVSMMQDDYKVEVWRALPGQAKRLENVYVIRSIRKSTTVSGVEFTEIVGVDGNDILTQRVVIGQEGDAYAKKTGLAGNVIKAYMRDAINGRFNSVRALIASYFTVAADANEWAEYASTPAAWATGNASFTKDRLLYTMLDAANSLAETSTGRGYPIWWYVYPVSGAEYQLRTYKTLMGADLTHLTLTPDNSMSAPVYEFSSMDEKNAIEVLGFEIVPGTRTSAYVRNILRASRTPFACREKALDLGSADFGEMREAYEDELSDPDNRPFETFKCGLSEIENFRYGREWDLGDKVSLSYRGFESEIVIKLVHVAVGATEKIEVSFSIEQELEIG